jgi:hypothetical protein
VNASESPVVQSNRVDTLDSVARFSGRCDLRDLTLVVRGKTGREGANKGVTFVNFVNWCRGMAHRSSNEPSTMRGL